MTCCIIYLADVIVFSKTESEHLHYLQMIFDWFCKHNLKLKPSKCNFLQQEITYLAHHVFQAGVKPSQENIQAIIDFPMPNTYSKIQAFLGLAGHFWQFIKTFAHLAGLLHKYLCGEGANWKSEGLQLSMDAKWAFKKIKQKLIKALVLAFANYMEPFHLETDASKEGLGAVLSPKQSNGKYHPITFASQTLNGHEENYHSLKLEFLALKWAITEHFKEYLMHGWFTVHMDNNPLTYILTTPNLDATGHCWVGALASYDYDLKYLKGTENCVIDVFSQVPVLLRQGSSEGNLLVNDSEDEEVAGPVEESYSSRDHEEGLSHWGSNVMKMVLEGVWVGTQNCINMSPGSPDNKLEAQTEMISVCKAEMHITYWAKVQSQDQYILIVTKWIDGKKKERLCKLLGDLATTSEGRSSLAKGKGLVTEKDVMSPYKTQRGYGRHWCVCCPQGTQGPCPDMGVIEMWDTKVRRGHWPYWRRGSGGPGCLAKIITWCKGANGVNCSREWRLGPLCRVSRQPPP